MGGKEPGKGSAGVRRRMAQRQGQGQVKKSDGENRGEHG